ncbi:23S rRNA (uracil(1939)-C(5))-methyltransferase RlmD [Gangjinia marincola]|uniref:23S rRNA (Uracil(1939)-C(5))-methyltransferase RlmD n=1 Tax=Gangjinia marincola TaxID=578463 RepID=A0ABN1MGB2_9FLAO
MARKNKRKIFEDITLIDAGAKGKSIGKAPDGKVIFVNNAVPGDIVDVQTTKKRKAFYEGSAIAIKEFSGKRTEPVCEDFGTCGGCKWQNMKYEEQLYFKQKEVINNLTRLGHVELPTPLPIVGSDKQYFYRNKMEFSFSNKRWLTPDEINKGLAISDKNALGFHIPRMWDKILNINKCHLQEDPSNAIRNSIHAFAVKNNLSFFDVRNQTGLLRTLMIRISSTGELMVLIQFYDDDVAKRELLLDYLKSKFPQITSLLYVINQKGNDTIYDQDVICYHGREYIFEEMEKLKFKVNAKSFYQTNSQQAYELYKITRDFAGLTGNELVYDLYTGTGTIAQFIAGHAKRVVGIEAVPEAIEDAKENARLNKISNTSFFAGDMKKVFTADFISENGQPDVIITDPPRDGMHKDVIDQIISISPKRIVYVSCNSATQARDLNMLDHSYKITKVQPVDMFPQTHHVENVVCLEKRSS